MATDTYDDPAHLRWHRMWSQREQLLKVARRRSLSEQDAEDAVHEAMLRAAQHTHLDDSRLGAWLTTVTMRLCVDRHRQVRREAELGSAPKLTAPGPVPVEEAVCDRAEARWVAYRSRELPARQAEALRLKSEDRDVDEIAREMGLSYQAVESLLARARRTLRNSLAGTLALGLWLIGRGRDQAGQAGAPAHALAAASAATLAVVGLVAVPFAYDADRERPGPPAVTGPGAAEVGAAGYDVPAATPSVRAEPPAAPPSPSAAPHAPAPSRGLLPVDAPVPLPPVPVPVPSVPVTGPVPSGVGLPDVDGALPAVTAQVPPLPEATAPVPTAPVPAPPGTGGVPGTAPSVPLPDAR
ncbi:RNA polymerase sigma factor [Streptomyces tritici]|uniref:RNA polymerase sigma factor n=1 Tax=Streptomyces tritici TaxID=2054410 RepID=UPI003AF19FAC